MEASLKIKIESIDTAIGILDDMVQEVDLQLIQADKYITDRLSAIVTDVKGIVECLRQNGVMDEDLIGFYNRS